MSALTDFESLKQQIVDVVTQDPAVKYILVGWMTDEFVPKTDYRHLLEELRAMREDSNRRFGEQAAETRQLREDSNRRFGEQAAETRQLREDSNRRFEEQAVETRQLREDSNRRFEEMHQEMQQGFSRQDRQFKILSAKIDKLGGRWGIRAETAFRNGMSSIVQELFDGTVSKWETEDAAGHVYGHSCRVELDIVIRNGQCIVVEIKSQAGRAEVAAFHRIIELYQQKTSSLPDRKVLIVADVDIAAKALAEKLGIEVFTMEEIEPE